MCVRFESVGADGTAVGAGAHRHGRGVRLLPQCVLAAGRRLTRLVAYKRLVDNVPRVVDLTLVRELPDAIYTSITQALRLAEPGATERCKRLLTEDQRIVAQRADLVARKRKLEELAVQYRAFAHGL